MTKTKELIILAFFVFVGMFTVYNWANAAESKCYPNVEFMKFIDDNKLVTIYNGSNGDTMFESMMSKDRHIFMVEYPKSKDGNAMVAEKYCVTNVISDVTFNENALDYLYNLLEKARGKKV